MTTSHDPFFYTDPSLIVGGKVVVKGTEARHLTLVRRARMGDLIKVSDGLGAVFDVRITAITSQEVVGEVLDSIRMDTSPPSVAVFQALAKAAKLELVIQKLVEIGVDEVVVFEATRSVPEWSSSRSDKALTRWRSIAREAAKQSRRPLLPRVEGPVSLEFAAKMLDGTVLVAHENADRRLREVLPADPPDRVCLVVGPEGGFGDADLEIFGRLGGIEVSLGSQILRTETAALVAATAVMYQYDRIG